MPRPPTADLPPGLSVQAVLSDSDRGAVLRVRRDGCDLVLRILRGTDTPVAAVASTLAGLSDPGLVPPTEWGLTPSGRPYLLRPWLDGLPFDEAARAAEPRHLAGWLRSLLGTLSTLHRAGLVHRDVKAGNVVVSGDRLQLIDLDLIASRGAAGAGSRLHIAPEVLLGCPHDASADLFSLGVMVAVALLGEPTAEFHRRFPARSFWEASGLDPERLDPALAPLVRALVRRHPLDRPASAADAARLLRGGGEPARPELALPFLEGREAALAALQERLLAPEPGQAALLLEVEDPEEERALLDHLQLMLVMQGRRAQRPDVEDLLERVPRDAPPADVVLVGGSAGLETSDVLASWLPPGERRSGRLLLTLQPDAARLLDAELRRRQLDVPIARLIWPRPPQAAVERHLARLSGGASPEVVRRLAASLHLRTSGRRADINRLLESAERLGVLRAEGGHLIPLLQDWPAGSDAEPLRLEELRTLPAEAGQVLLALSCLDAPPADELLAEVAQLPADACAVALLRLRARGLVTSDGRVADPRSADAARAAFGAGAWADCHRRCAEALARLGEPEGRCARHRLHAARDEPELERVLETAQAELAGGRLAEARALVQGLGQRLGSRPSRLSEGLLLVEARLDLAQGRADDALATLRRAHGGALSAAPVAVLLVAAHAHEQSGRRGEARALFRRALSSATERTDRLRALTGLGYGYFLDGAWDEALAVLRGEPAEDDPDEPAAGVLNLRGVTLTRMGRHEEADAALTEALARATRSGDPLARARTELNRAHLNRRRARPAAAVAGLQRAIAAFEEAGHVQGRALALNNLGVLQRDRGELRRAAALLEEALDLRWRVGDAHGAASSLGSLALVELERGQVGAALGSLARARELMLHGDYEAELLIVDLHLAIALALAGRQTEATERLRAAHLPAGRADHAALAARAEALVRLAGGERDRALQSARSAQGQAANAGELAEEFRATALLMTLLPGDARVAASLSDLAARLDSDERRAEAALRTLADPASADAATLEGWLNTFEDAGCSDLVMTTGQLLARCRDAQGDLVGRRRALARATEAADALADGLPHHEKDATVERLARLAGLLTGDDVDRRRLTVDWFLDCNRRMASESDLPGLLLAIVDMALELTGARHGFLVLLDGDRIDMQVARGVNEADLSPEEVRFSRTVVREAVTTRAAVLTTDAAHDPRFQGTESITSLRLRSVLCVPLLPGTLSGALYLDSEPGEPAFDADDAAAAASLADQAAVAIGSLRRRSEIESLNRRLSDRVALQADELQRARQMLRRRGDVAPVGGLVGDSEAMQRVYALIDRLAPTSLPVIVTGPTGVGKDLVARALHARSRRADGPLVVENVSALPGTLLESELFGHVRGAFTGADRERVGLFVEADGGTFFLDEIGDMPIELQAKLLRVLESGELRPLGARKPVKVDVRIVAATNRDLRERVRAGAFREDLFYRLNAAEIRVPPLAERLDDIPLLARHILAQLNAKHGTSKVLDEHVIQALVAPPWPGQVRELSNEVARLYFLSDEVIADPDLLRGAMASATAVDPMPASLRLEDIEHAAVLRALHAAGNRKDKAARLLGISRAGLYARLKRMGQA